jgi:hypothetical protein
LISAIVASDVGDKRRGDECYKKYAVPALYLRLHATDHRVRLAMDVLVLAIQICAVVFLIYGIGLCAWIAYKTPRGEQRWRPLRGRRDIRLVSDEPVKQPADEAANQVKRKTTLLTKGRQS